MSLIAELKALLNQRETLSLANSTPSQRVTLVAAGAVGVPLVAYIVVRLLGPPLNWLFSPDAAPFWLSLRVAVPATLIAGIFGVAAGFGLAKGRFAGRDTLEAVGSLPVILPPTVLGYYLVTQLGSDSLVGRIITTLVGHAVVYRVSGCIIVATIAAFPFCMRASRAAIEGVDPAFERVSRTLGLAEWRIALQVTIPLARRGIAAGLTFGLLRALGEYGATLLVGGNIPNTTRTMSLAVAAATSTPRRHDLILILVAMAVSALAIVAWLGRGRA